MKTRKGQSAELNNEVPVTILQTSSGRGGIRLRVALSPGFYEELYAFMNEKGFLCYGHEKPGLSLIIEYGLSSQKREDLVTNARNMGTAMSRYAAIRFRVHECYEENNKIASGLRIMLALNKSLKRRLRENGLGEHVQDDEWDSWDEDTINGFYREYVFGK